jgi:hypothetical protein
MTEVNRIRELLRDIYVTNREHFSAESAFMGVPVEEIAAVAIARMLADNKAKPTSIGVFGDR